MEYEYWFYYSSEEFSAYVIRSSKGWHPIDEDPDFSGHYHGPFTTLRRARQEVAEKINGDIGELRRMLRNTRAPASKRYKF